MSNLRLTKATRKYIAKAFNLLPHIILQSERVSLRHRLEDAKKERDQIQKRIQETTDRKEFRLLHRTELPRVERLIQRIENELLIINDEINEAYLKHSRYDKPIL